MPTTRTHRLFPLTSLLGVLGVLSIAQPAAAATQRFASPSGAPSATCPAVSPCDLYTAVSAATGGDDVSVMPGDYTLSGTVIEPADITIHGVAGKPRPRLMFVGPVQEGFSIANGSTLRYLEIDQEYPGHWAADGISPNFDQLVVRGSANTPCSVETADGGTITNSIVVANNTAICVDADTSVDSGINTTSVRNVTAISYESGAAAISADAKGASAIVTLILSNVIARGGASGDGFRARTDDSGAHVTISAGHSNFTGWETFGTNANVVDAGGNQGGAPTFVDPANGDYHQAAGSATIDAGVTLQANGTQDVDGDPRTLGASTDIGADEFVPPSPPGQPGQPNPGQPGTPTTTTPGTPTPTTLSTTPTPTSKPFAGVTLLSSRLRFTRRAIDVLLWCPAGTTGRCSGQTTLTTRVRLRHTHRTTTVILGRATFSIVPVSEHQVTVHISRAGLKLLARLRRLTGTDTNAARNGAGQSKTTSAAVTIRRVVAKRHH